MRKIIKEVRKLGKLYDVKVRFKNLKNIGGVAVYTSGEIIINSNDKSRQVVLSTFFHELVHILCYRKGVWKDYHGFCNDINKIKKIALRVERFVDRKAAKLLYSYDKRIRYLPGYLNQDDKECRDFLNEHYDSFKL